MMRSLYSLISPGGSHGRLSILILHRVLARPDPLFPGEIDAGQFDQICAWLKEWFCVLPLDEALRKLRQGQLPRRALAITFDDGYADNHDVALPILKRHGLTATFYVATGFLNGGRMWNDSVIESIRLSHRLALDFKGTPLEALGSLQIGEQGRDALVRRKAIDRVIAEIKYRAPAERQDCVHALADRAGVELPKDLMMNSAQVRALREQGMLVGAHTVSHPILAKLTAQQARAEIGDSKDWLEALLGEPVRQFAYPNGKPGEDYLPETVDVVRSLGFDAAVSTVWGAARMSNDPFQIPRFTPWDRSRFKFGLRLAENLVRR